MAYLFTNYDAIASDVSMRSSQMNLSAQRVQLRPFGIFALQ